MAHGSVLVYSVHRSRKSGSNRALAMRIRFVSAWAVTSLSVRTVFSASRTTFPLWSTSSAPKGWLPCSRACRASSIARRRCCRSPLLIRAEDTVARERERRGCVSRQSSYVLNVPFLRAASTHSVWACRRAAASFSGAITTWSLIACSWRPHSGHVYVAGFWLCARLNGPPLGHLSRVGAAAGRK